MCASYGFQLRRIHRTAVILVNSGSQRKSGEKHDDSSQHTLLKNGIRALYLSKELVETELLRMGVAAVRCEV